MEHAYEILARRIEASLSSREHLILAIDGRSASGKTTLAARLSGQFKADVIHMDDFFSCRFPCARLHAWQNPAETSIMSVFCRRS